MAAAGSWGTGNTEDASRLQQLAEATALLAATETIDEVTEVIVERVAPVVDATVVTVMLRDGDELRLVASRGLSADVRQRWQRFALGLDTPAGRAVAEGGPVLVTAPDDINRLFPALDGAAPEGRALVCVPMRAERSVLGALAMTFGPNWGAPRYELDFFTTFADSCAQTIRRIEASDAARLRARRLAFLADASEELASSLDYRATLQNVAQLVVPDIADWCSVALVEDGELHTVAVAGDCEEEQLRRAHETDAAGVLTVALAARGRNLGRLTLLRADGSAYGPEDAVVAADVAHRAALAIDNALLYTQAHDVALQLQRAVLPERLDALPGWDVSASYWPGDRAEVGGDFYDAVALSPSRVAVFIGDVMGHGLAAAAAMAAMRSAVRAYLSLDPAPDAVVSSLDRMFVRLDITQLVTLVYGIVDADAGEVRFVNAGHPAPLLLPGDGAAQLLATPPRRPLGAGGDDRLPVTFPFGPDDTLLLYTDGLVERRGQVIDQGIERLLARATTLGAVDLDGALRKLVDDFEENPDDDVTAIAVRRERDVANG